MIIFFMIAVLIMLFGLRKAGNGERDYMSIKMTNSIKGFFLCMVFFSHIWGYTEFSHPLDEIYQKLIRGRCGQCIVTMFLFYSGYGIMESIKKKGQDYISGIPIKRFLNVLLQFDCAVLLFWMYRYFTGTRYGLKTMLLTFIGWDGIGNSNWYIFCVLWLYIFTFIAFKVFNHSHIKAVIGIFTLSMLYMIIMCRLGKEYWWYDTILCYSWGMLFSLYRRKVENIVNESWRTWIYFLVIFIVGHCVTFYYKNNGPIVYQLWVFLFVAAIVTFTMRYVIDNPILRGGGIMLFELYILQRLSMMILKPHMLTNESTAAEKYVYLIACFCSTIAISIIYRNTIGRIIKNIIEN